MSGSIEEKILLYSHLSPEERRDVERYVEAHPELEALLAESRTFEAVLSEARLLDEDPPGDDALAYYLLTHRLSRHPGPPSVQAAFERMQARLRTDPALRARGEALARRLAALEAGTDAVAQFERLTGHTLRLARREEPAAPRGMAPRAPVSRSARRARRLASVLIAGVALYGSLWLAGRLARPEAHRVAAFDAVDVAAQDLRWRSAGPSAGPASADDLYQQALVLLGDASVGTFGLFPRYDTDRLDRAAALLGQVVLEEDDGAPLQLEASYLLGKIHVLQGDVDQGRDVLRAVADRQRWRADDAATLLEALGDRDR